jgi:rubredoxin
MFCLTVYWFSLNYQEIIFCIYFSSDSLPLFSPFVALFIAKMVIKGNKRVKNVAGRPDLRDRNVITPPKQVMSQPSGKTDQRSEIPAATDWKKIKEITRLKTRVCNRQKSRLLQSPVIQTHFLGFIPVIKSFYIK